MLKSVTRMRAGAKQHTPVLAALAATLLLSSCGSMDFLHFGDSATPQIAPPPALRQAEEQPVVDSTFWPTHGWRSSSPEAQGIDSAVLANALETIRDRNIPVNSLLIE